MLKFPKPRPRIFDKRSAKHDAEAEKRAVYAEVDARDGKRCRVCNRRGNPYALDALGKIHRCHLKDASLGGAMSAANIFSGCWICHALIHAKQITPIGLNANRPLRFEITPGAVADVFGTRLLPPHVSVRAYRMAR